MNRITRWSFRNKSAVGLLIVMVLVVGILSYFRLPMELVPSADDTTLTITVIGPGYDAKSMESEVTAPLEQALNGLKGKKNAFSTSGDGYTKIDLYFESDTKMKEAKQEAEEALSQVQLPERVSKPYVMQYNTSMIPISQLSIAFADGLSSKEQEQLQKDVVNQLQKVKGVANVMLDGKSAPVVSVKADPAKMAQAAVPYQNLFTLLQGRNSSVSAGELTLDGQSGNLQVTSSLSSLDALKDLPILPGVPLKNVADVTTKDVTESISRLNGNDALFAAVNKEAKANAVTVSKEIAKTVERLNKEYSGKLQMDIFFDTSDFIVDSVNSMMREVLLGALFATIVILFFLRSLRITLITIVSIPLSLALTLYLLSLSGVTLNIITLGGVAVAVGRLVDDSIVVIENIYRRLQKEKFSVDMLIDATKEVATAITASTITTVAVFLPMGLLKGNMQALLLPFALTVTYSLLGSLFVALTVVPLLGSVLLRKAPLKEHKPPQSFIRFLDWNLQHKAIPLILVLVVFVGSIAAYIKLPKGAVSTQDSTFMSVELNYPSDTPVSKVIEEGKRLESYLIAQPERKYVLMQSGNSSENAKWGSVVSPTLVSYSIILKDGKEAKAFEERIKATKDQYPGGTLTAGVLNLMGGSSTSVYVDIVGDDASQLGAVAKEAVDKIKPVSGVDKVESNEQNTKPVFKIEVNPSEANGSEVAQQLQGMLNPIPLGTITLENRTSTVQLEPLASPQKLDELKNLTITTAAGPVSLTQVASIHSENEPSMLYHKDGKPYVRISAQADPNKLSEVGKDIQKAVDQLTVPKGVDVLVGGASADQSSDMSSLFMVLLVSIGLVYLIMVLTFKTLRAPFAIIMSLPLAAIGAVIGLIVARVTPDYTAIFGALMLVGIVVTNAIVLIDRVKHNEEHMSIRESLLEAAGTRMRPILMTALATICAMLPLLFGETEMGSIVSKSLAIVVVGGLTAATFLTLVIVPAVYELLHFRKSARQRREGTAAVAAVAAAQDTSTF
ncbi:efflux RND transporter permease subunit [Gorillibacterium timonense]|uniref:efflux RND transporter permease subunit n=1 Tax=Gorillibacterium timonense TaxID=1689269 RepID=UPI00071DC1A6|nr:efflux RND transporter permease subunit [Gorillibacterium timonense]